MNDTHNAGFRNEDLTCYLYRLHILGMDHERMRGKDTPRCINGGTLKTVSALLFYLRQGISLICSPL